MVKIYGKDETVSSSEFWDGRTKNNLLQDFLKKEFTNFLEFVQPIKEIISQQFETFDFLEGMSQIKLLQHGVMENSFLNEFNITTHDIVRITIFNNERIFARLPPGIVVFNNNINIHKPAVVLASKQLENIFEMKRPDQSLVEIKYSYVTDSFKCKISKKPDPTEPAITYYYPENIWEDDSIAGYSHSAELLEVLYNDVLWKDYFVNKVGSDLTKINIEQLVELTESGDYYWVINSSGNIELTQTLGTAFKICSFTNTHGVITNINNTHQIYQTWGEPQIDEYGYIFFESPSGLKFLDGTGSNITMSPDGKVIISNSDGHGNAMSSIIMDEDVIEIDGNFSVTGVTSSTGTATLQVESNVIELNNGMVDDPPVGLKSGLLVHRGTNNPVYNFVYDEVDLQLKGGLETDLKVMAQREDAPINTGIPFWNSTTKIFETSNNILWNGSKLLTDVDKVDGLHANDLAIVDDSTLATKNKVKTYVDDTKTDIESIISGHTGSTSNPHATTQSQVGLSNVPNWSGSTNTALGNSNTTIPSQLAIKTYVDALNSSIPWGHFNSTSNPHSTSQSQVGLSNVPNWTGLTTINRNPLNWVGTVTDTEFVSAALIKGYIDYRFLGVDFVHFGSTSNPHATTQSQVGLSNVPNWTSLISYSGITPTDTQFPSAKLVKDYVDYKIQNHDSEHGDIYYTKIQSDITLSGKSNTGHTHLAANITDITTLGQNIVKKVHNNLSATYLKAELNGTLSLRTFSDVLIDIAAEPAFIKNQAFNKDFGTTNTTVCVGNDSRLSDNRYPTTHSHGNITSVGKIGLTENLVVATTTNGLLTTTGRTGIDDRSAFPPEDHTHGNITSVGKIGSTENLVVVTGASGVLTTTDRTGIDDRSAFPPEDHTHTINDVGISTISFSESTIDSETSILIPAGSYYIKPIGTVNLEIFDDPDWFDMGSLLSGRPNFIISDGINFRIKNNSTTLDIVVYFVNVL